MEDSFEIPVRYRGEDLEFTSSLKLMGYTYKIEVDVYGQMIMFEPDEEKNFRAIVDVETFDQNKKIDIELLKAIAEALEGLLK